MLTDVNSGDLPLASDLNQLVDVFKGTHDLGNSVFFAPQILPPSLTNVTLQTQTGTTLGIGTYKYQFTLQSGYYRSNGQFSLSGETSVSLTLSITTTSSKQSVKINLPTTGLPASAAAWAIYRTANNGSTYGLVGTIRVGNAIFNDSVADSARGAAPPTTNTTGSQLGVGGQSTAPLSVTNMGVNDTFRVYTQGGQLNTGNLLYAHANNDYNSSIWLWGGTGSTQYSDFTQTSNNSSNYYMNIPATVSSYLYIGNTSKVTYHNVSMHTNGVGGTYSFQYWNGTAWANLTTVVDGTAGFTKNGLITFTAPSDWALKTPSQDTTWGQSTTATVSTLIGGTTAQYWIRIGVTTAPTTAAYSTYFTPSPLIGNLLYLTNGSTASAVIDGFGNMTLSGLVYTPLSQVVWNSITLQNAWYYYGSGAVPAYRKDGNNNVYVKGLIKSGTAANGTVLFNLPAGFRPKEIRYFVAFDGALTPTRVEVDPNGNVSTAQGTTINNGFLILDGIIFPAEQ